MTLNKNTLLSYCNLIIKNIETNGWERYDPIDFRGQEIMHSNIFLRKTVLTLETFLPIGLRKLFQVKKNIYPTTFFFVAAAYLTFEQNNIQTNKSKSSIDIMEKCIKEYLSIDAGEIWWNYNVNKTFYPDPTLNDKRPTMPLYFIARCNQILYKIGVNYGIEDYINLSKNTLDKTLRYHKIYTIDDEQKSICYYYNSKDSTINVNTEIIEWMALCQKETEYEKLIQDILNMVLNNQNEDGSWYYFSRWHKEKIDNNYGGIDAHHTATVLYNLIHFAELRNDEELSNAIDKGMNYFIDHFFESNTGRGKVVIGKFREAGSVQYAESIIALVDYAKSFINFDKSVKSKAVNILPKIMTQMLRLIKKSSGAAASEKIIKRNYLDSIRWGNGPVLYAIAKYMEYCQE